MSSTRDPTDTNPDDAWVDTLLLKLPDHVDDGGFTDAVLARLPKRRTSKVSRRDIVIGLSAMAAAVVGALQLAHGPVLTLATPVTLASLAVVVGLGLWGALASAEA